MSTLVNSTPIPLQNPIAQAKRPKYRAKGEQADPQEGMLTFPWLEFFTAQSLAIEQAPARIKSVALSTQSASIGALDMSDGALSAGLYRITYYARITQAASISSSLTVSFDWTDGGVTPVFTGAAITGNTVQTFKSETLLILIDQGSPVRYSTVYASSGTPMAYKLEITLEQILA